MSHVDPIARFIGKVLVMGKVTMPGMFTAKSPSFHHELTDAFLDLKNTFINIIAPRGHAKSSIIACLCVLYHLFVQDRGTPKFVLLISKTGPHATRLLQTIKNVLEFSSAFQAFFGYHGQHNARRWREDEIMLDSGEVVMAKGTGMQVVGLKVGDQRPTLIVVDDPEDMENTKTPEALDYNLRWFLQQLVPTRDAKRGRIVVIGTPQAQTCIVEKLCTASNWKTLRYQALAQFVEDDHQLQADLLSGKVLPTADMSLWPELWDAVALLKEKETADSVGKLSSWYREFQCKVISDEEALFKPADILTYNGEVRWDRNKNPYMQLLSDAGEETDRFAVNIYLGVDPAVSTAGTADYTVIMPTAISPENDRYILPYMRGRWAPSEVIDRLLAENDYWRPVTARLETSGQQEIYADVLRHLVADGRLNLVTHKPRDSKSKRYLQGLEPWFRKKKVYILKNMGDLRSELIAFRPDGRHAHDDMIDAMYYSFKNAYPPTHVVERQKTSTTPIFPDAPTWAVR